MRLRWKLGPITIWQIQFDGFECDCDPRSLIWTQIIFRFSFTSGGWIESRFSRPRNCAQSICMRRKNEFFPGRCSVASVDYSLSLWRAWKQKILQNFVTKFFFVPCFFFDSVLPKTILPTTGKFNLRKVLWCWCTTLFCMLLACLLYSFRYICFNLLLSHSLYLLFHTHTTYSFGYCAH